MEKRTYTQSELVQNILSDPENPFIKEDVMEKTDLENRFSFHAPGTEEKKQAHENVRNMCLRLSIDLDALVPEGREKSLMVTKLEEVMMWANAGIARQK